MPIKEAILILALSLVPSSQLLPQDSSTELDGYAGKYSRYAGAYGQNEISVIHEDDSLFFQPSGQGRISSTQDEEVPGLFYLDVGSPIEIRFNPNDKGGFDSLTLST